MSDFDNLLRGFLETYSLYAWADITPPEYLSQFCSLSQIEMECELCRRSRPFSDRRARGSGMGQTPQKTKAEIYCLSFLCDGCSTTKYSFFIQVSHDLLRIRKVGQAPAWSVSLDKRLAKFLGDDSETFKKGMICESQGYGIAAYAYYRRVVERCIDAILQSLRLSLEETSTSPDLLDRLDGAMSGTVMIDRIKIAKDCVPSHLRPGNMNPLSIIYDSLSVGIHRLSDNECLEQAQSIRIALRYLVKTLSEQNEEQKEYIEALRALNHPPS